MYISCFRSFITIVPTGGGHGESFDHGGGGGHHIDAGYGDGGDDYGYRRRYDSPPRRRAQPGKSRIPILG
jgi:hypothetical protein